MTAAPIEFEVWPSATPVPDADRDAVLASPGFGTHFTDHMVTLRWSSGRGWHDGRLEPYGPFQLDPSTAAFHYAQELFEGTKAYRQDSGAIVLFRPADNAARFNRSARRLAMPELPEATFIDMLELLVDRDHAWVPSGAGTSLYLRPFTIATQPTLGFTLPSDSYLLCTIASPATYLTGRDPRPLTVWLGEEHARATPGGTGDVKASCNYAPAFATQRHATAQGCDQVVWLDTTHTWVEELGGMNLFFVYGTDHDRPRITTPPLSGTLLPGITRDSLLQLAPTLGIDAAETAVSVDQWRQQAESGELTEVFACGTAATVVPIGRVRSTTGDWTVGDGTPGPVTCRLREELMAIQYGTRPDPFGWVHKVR